MTVSVKLAGLFDAHFTDVISSASERAIYPLVRTYY